ncbi:hypothetical protein [Lactococcus petauri]|uniref:hypothetical protein n=1 Tax=Lactococcus petauri TaxID=1940789 RepID=UPI001F594A47|nr:hypothetical protein [Lactococcus petauri]
MKQSLFGFTIGSVAFLGIMAAAPVVHAAEVNGEAKDTQTEVKIIDSPDPDVAVLKLTHVPEQYKFETKLKADGAYQINGGITDINKNITVFNDKSIQDWSVKASIDDTQLNTATGKTATVIGFKINGKELMGENADQIVHKSEASKTVDNNTGNISKEVKNDGLSIEFNNEKHDLKTGDILTGKVHYQLYNTPDIK